MAKEFHRLIFLAVTLVFFTPTQVFSAEILTRQPLVVIDPGHDNAAPGLESKAGNKEAALTLALARQLSVSLSDTCRTRLTRTSADQPLEPGRVELANHEKADIFLSLHLHNNLSSQPIIFFFSLPEPRDTDTWHTRALRSRDQSKKLAGILSATLREKNEASRPLTLSGPILPLEGLNMPGLLIEPFSLSQVPAEPDKRAAFLADQAHSMADALLTFLEAE